MRFPLRSLILLCALAVFRPAEAAHNIRVAAAADLKFALDELGMRYEKQSLEAAGLAEPGTLYAYALGRIVIWMPADTRVDLSKLGWKALLDPDIQKIAIGNPEHAPYGRAAVAALRNAGIYEQVRAKLVYGENIAQAAQFVASGNAQAGILALSLAISPPMREGKRWDIPTNMHPPIEQAAVILRNAKDKDGARAFLIFLKSAEARKILESYGFSVPASAKSQ